VTVETGLLHLAGAVCREVVYLNSATPSSLCVPPNPEMNVQVIRAARPAEWPHELVREAIDRAVSTE
jgi:ADP-heptose:LPS heptosyltransferase